MGSGMEGGCADIAMNGALRFKALDRSQVPEEKKIQPSPKDSPGRTIRKKRSPFSSALFQKTEDTGSEQVLTQYRETLSSD